MNQLQQCVRVIRSLQPQTMTNVLRCSDEDTQDELEKKKQSIETAEDLVTFVVKVVSEGLYPGLEVWHVVQNLERLSVKRGGGLNSTHNSPVLASSVHQSQEANRYKFAVSTIFLLKSSLPRCSDFVKSRAFVRCALNTGCLLASLELLADMHDVMGSLMADNGLLRCKGSPRWDKFMKVIALVGGPPLEMVNEGAPLRAAVQFSYEIYLPQLDDDMDRIDKIKQQIYASTIVASATTVPPSDSESSPVLDTLVADSREPTVADHQQIDDGESSSLSSTLVARKPRTAKGTKHDTEGDVSSPVSSPSLTGGGKKRVMVKKMVVKKVLKKGDKTQEVDGRNNSTISSPSGDLSPCSKPLDSPSNKEDEKGREMTSRLSPCDADEDDSDTGQLLGTKSDLKGLPSVSSSTARSNEQSSSSTGMIAVNAEEAMALAQQNKQELEFTTLATSSQIQDSIDALLKKYEELITKRSAIVKAEAGQMESRVNQMQEEHESREERIRNAITISNSVGSGSGSVISYSQQKLSDD